MTGPAGNGTKTAAVFDLEAAAAVTEAGAEPFPFTFKGTVYTVPPATQWEVAALALLGQGDLEGALTALIGAETFTELAAAGLTLGHLNALFTELGERAGFPSLPNLPPPPPRNSGPRSKRR